MVFIPQRPAGAHDIPLALKEEFKEEFQVWVGQLLPDLAPYRLGASFAAYRAALRAGLTTIFAQGLLNQIGAVFCLST
jgi:hypothetical protein